MGILNAKRTEITTPGTETYNRANDNFSLLEKEFIIQDL